MEQKILYRVAESWQGTGVIPCDININNFPAHDEEDIATRDAIIIAHDVIEHVNGIDQLGSVVDELQSFGAILHTRCKFEPHPLQHDISYCAKYWEPTIIEEQPANDYDEDIMALLYILKHDSDYGDDFFDDVPEGFDRDRFLYEVLQYMRIGARKQEARFEHSHHAYDMFMTVMEVGQKMLDEVYENQIFCLTFDIEEGTASYEEVY